MPLALILPFLNPVSWPSWLRTTALVLVAAVSLYGVGNYRGRAAVKAQWQAVVAQQNAAAEKKRIETEARVEANDKTRAKQFEDELTAFKEKTARDAKALKHPTRECFGADDTRRVQRLFER